MKNENNGTTIIIGTELGGVIIVFPNGRRFNLDEDGKLLEWKEWAPLPEGHWEKVNVSDGLHTHTTH